SGHEGQCACPSVSDPRRAGHRCRPRVRVGIVRFMPTIRRCLTALACALALATTACATTAPRCAPGQQAAIDERLYFGTQRPGGVVTDREWESFADDVTAPSFHAGFTACQAQGAWRGTD